MLRRCKEEASVRQQNSAPEPEDGEEETHSPTLLILEREEVYRQLQQRVLSRRYHLVWKESSEEILQALARADQALYQAKRQGKGRCCLWQPESPA